MKNKKIKKLVTLALLLAIEIVLTFTPLGFIPVGPLRATTLHIPVIIAGLVLGRKYGAVMGLFFGLISLFNNTFNPTITSFVFSPFVTVGGISGNFGSLIVVLVPRIILGYLSGLIPLKIKNQKIKVYITATISTFVHTLLVLSFIIIFFGQQYSFVTSKTLPDLIYLFITIIATNGVLEMIIATIIVQSIYRFVKIE